MVLGKVKTGDLRVKTGAAATITVGQTATGDPPTDAVCC